MARGALAIWFWIAARDAAERALSSLMIFAQRVIKPKQSPSTFWKSKRKMFCWTLYKVSMILMQ